MGDVYSHGHHESVLRSHRWRTAENSAGYLLAGRQTERTSLEMVRSKPLPFPPEPFAYAGVQLTRWSLAAADRHGGRRNLWLRTLDRAGLGFDS